MPPPPAPGAPRGTAADRQPVRVLYVHPFAEPLSGPDESLLLLLGALGARVRATVVLPPASPFRARYLAAGVTLVEQPLSRIRRLVAPAAVARYGVALARGTAGLVHTLREQRAIDVVHVNAEVCIEGGLAARVAGVPCVCHYRGNTLDRPAWVFDALTAAWSTLAVRVFAISEGCRDVFATRGRGARVEVLYNPVDLEALSAAAPSRAATRAALGVADESTPVVLSVARLHPRKDFGTFLRAAARVRAAHPRARFWIAGCAAPDAEGAAHARELAALRDALGLSSTVALLGARRDVASLLAGADVFVTSARHEGFGRALAEAMGAARACVATREGAHPELLGHGAAGVLVPPVDPAALGDAVAELLAAPTRRAELGAAARRRAEALFDPQRHADRVLSVYNSVLAGRAR